MQTIDINNKNECFYCKWGTKGKTNDINDYYCNKPSGNFMSRTWQSCEYFIPKNDNFIYKIDVNENYKIYKKAEAYWQLRKKH